MMDEVDTADVFQGSVRYCSLGHLTTWRQWLREQDTSLAKEQIWFLMLKIVPEVISPHEYVPYLQEGSLQGSLAGNDTAKAQDTPQKVKQKAVSVAFSELENSPILRDISAWSVEKACLIDEACARLDLALQLIEQVRKEFHFNLDSLEAQIKISQNYRGIVGSSRNALSLRAFLEMDPEAAISLMLRVVKQDNITKVFGTLIDPYLTTPKANQSQSWDVMANTLRQWTESGFLASTAFMQKWTPPRQVALQLYSSVILGAWKSCPAGSLGHERLLEMINTIEQRCKEHDFSDASVIAESGIDKDGVKALSDLRLLLRCSQVLQKHGIKPRPLSALHQCRTNETEESHPIFDEMMSKISYSLNSSVRHLVALQKDISSLHEELFILIPKYHSESKLLQWLCDEASTHAFIDIILIATDFEAINELFIRGQTVLPSQQINGNILDTCRRLYNTATDGDLRKGNMRSCENGCKLLDLGDEKAANFRELLYATAELFKYELPLDASKPLVPVDLTRFAHLYPVFKCLISNNSRAYLQADTLVNLFEKLCKGSERSYDAVEVRAQILATSAEVAVSERDVPTAHKICTQKLRALYNMAADQNYLIWKTFYQCGKCQIPNESRTARGLQSELLKEAISLSPAEHLSETIRAWQSAEAQQSDPTQIHEIAKPSMPTTVQAPQKRHRSLFESASSAARMFRKDAAISRDLNPEALSNAVTSKFTSGLGWVLGVPEDQIPR